MTATRDEQFSAFVVAERAGMVRTATLLTAGDAHLAEDLVQSTLTALYVAWPVFQRAGNPRGYLRRSLVNAMIDERRRPWRRREQSLPVLPDSADRPGRHLADPPDRTAALHRALRDLPPRMRAAVVFRYFHDLTVAETADALTCSQGTVKSQTARALDKLREALDGTVAVPHVDEGDRVGAVPVAAVGAAATAAPADGRPAAARGPGRCTPDTRST